MIPRPRICARLSNFASDEHGGPAAEFAIIAPVAVALILLAINMGFLMYAGATLNFATQDAARCGAIGTTCSDEGATEVYAASRYAGPAINPDFTAVLTATCSQVTATATYNFSIGLASGAVPLSTSACYPTQPTA